MPDAFLGYLGHKAMHDIYCQPLYAYIDSWANNACLSLKFDPLLRNVCKKGSPLLVGMVNGMPVLHTCESNSEIFTVFLKLISTYKSRCARLYWELFTESLLDIDCEKLTGKYIQGTLKEVANKIRLNSPIMSDWNFSSGFNA